MLTKCFISKNTILLRHSCAYSFILVYGNFYATMTMLNSYIWATKLREFTLCCFTGKKNLIPCCAGVFLFVCLCVVFVYSLLILKQKRELKELLW